MMNIIVDTSVLIAVLTSEPEKQKLINLTRGMDLLAPGSVHWEIGNALAAMLKRKRITQDQIQSILEAYNQIPIRFMDINLVASLQVAADYDLYAYDAYIIACARENHCSLISLDKALCKAALNARVNVLEVFL
jgi:predicted nucleic acid-binding protein